MLTLLRIENFILIDETEVEFNKGLSVMTGETGAGKSVIIGALNLALGGKASKDLIRKGADKASIQAVFELSSKTCDEIKDGYDIPFEDNKLIITRTLSLSGRTNIRMNGLVVSLNVLKEICKDLVDMHGQHEHQSLLDPSIHLNLLDLYGGKEIASKIQHLNTMVMKIQKLDFEMKEIADDELEVNRKLDRLNFEIEELDSAELLMDEDLQLEEHYRTLLNIENVKKNLTVVNELMNSDEYESLSVLKLIKNALRLLGEHENINSDLKRFHEEMNQYYYDFEDLCSRIENYQDSVFFDEEDYKNTELRLNTINNLKRKYGHSIEDILTYHNKIVIEHQRLSKALEEFREYQSIREVMVKEYLVLANELSEARKSIAHKFELELKRELIELNFSNSVFQVNFTEKRNSEISLNGFDHVEYLISLNKGEAPKPLKRIASGGELSRIMLAIKIIFARVDQVPILVFDEIDTGISGHTASIVGEKIHFISQFHQVLCISHLPQIAVMADHHYLIEKTSDHNSTITHVKKLSEVQKVNELSRLIGGKVITDKTKANAKEMLLCSNKKKESRHNLSNL